MSKAIGIQLGSDGDLLISSQSMSIGNTLYQNQYLILKAQKCEFKHYPTLGAGIEDMVNDDDMLGWKKTIREELTKDDMVVSTLTITDDGMTLAADYK